MRCFVRFLRTALWVLAATGQVETLPAADVKQAPNVLMICADDMNDWLACLRGHPNVQTPHLDRLACRGVLFTNAHAPTTTCNPSRTAVLDTREHGEIISPHDIARYKDCAIVVDQRDLSPWKVRAYRVADGRTGRLLPVERWRVEWAVCAHFVGAKPDTDRKLATGRCGKLDLSACSPPAEFGGSCVPVDCSSPVTITQRRRVRPQALVFDNGGKLAKLLYTTDGSHGVSIATVLAETSDGGTSWEDHPANPVLDRIESDWQGSRAFVTAVTWDEDNKRWVMATVGNDATTSTPGIRATGLWFSEDLARWTQYSENPIITVQTDDAIDNEDVFPGNADPPVGMYLRHFHKSDVVWYALVQWRGAGTWSRMTVMRSDGDITGPWKIHNLCLDPKDATVWFKKNRNLNWCQPVRAGGRWYAACQNGVARGDQDNDRIGIVYSDDYFHWHEFDNPVTPPLTRPDGSAVVSSQQFLLPPEDGKPWRILLGARGVYGNEYMYLVYPKGRTPDP